MSDHEAYAVNVHAMRRAFSAASAEYDRIAVLQAEVRTRLLERLDIIKLEPTTVLDLGCGTAQASRELQQRYSHAQVIALDAAFGMVQQARQQQSFWSNLLGKSFTRVCADAYRLPFKDASIDLVFSNLMLQWCDPPDVVFAEVRRVLKPQGAFLFTSFGPDTLKELRAAWSAVDVHTHVNRFIDMHDLGDAMVRAGLAEPVLDVERITLTYPDVMSLMRELKAVGAHNVTAGRRAGLTSRTALKQLSSAYENFRREGVLPASYEVVYGQAWGNVKTSTAHDGEVRIPLNKIGGRRRS